MTTGTSTATADTSIRPAAHPLRGDIEGLRAIAVLMVLLYHVGVPGLRGGFAGVDVFFVISGYLITGQLVREARRDGRVSLPRFYARRARRLLPAASVVLAATAISGWWALPRSRHGELGTDILGATAYVVNWVLAGRQVDYLAEDSAPSLVQHYWSLSVEEQFYVLWPLLIIGVLFASRWLGFRLMPALTLVLAMVVAASFAWSVLHTADSPGTAYFVTTTRVWQLGVGALLVLITPVLRRLPPVRAATLAGVGLAMILCTLLLFSTTTPWPGTAAALPTLGTAAVIAGGIASGANPTARFLGLPSMRLVGGLSYGLYLWHWPALMVLDEINPGSGLLTRLAVAALSIALAWLTLHLVENPIRFHPVLATRPWHALTFGAVAMALSATIGISLILTAPSLRTTEPTGTGAQALVVPSSKATESLRLIDDPSVHFTNTGPLTPDPVVATKDIPLAAYDRGCQVPQDSEEIVTQDACWFGDPQGERTVALVGDSKMLQWLTALEPIARQESWRIKVYTKSSCGFITVHAYPECIEYNRRLSQHLAQPGQTPDLIFVSMGATETEEKPGMSQSLADNLRPAMAGGAKVWLFADNPGARRAIMPGNVRSYECVDEHRDDYSACSYPGDAGTGTITITRAAEILDAPVINLNRWVCPVEGPSPTCPPAIAGTLLFRQGTHLTATYVSTLTPILHHELVRAGAATTPFAEISWPDNG